MRCRQWDSIFIIFRSVFRFFFFLFLFSYLSAFFFFVGCFSSFCTVSKPFPIFIQFINVDFNTNISLIWLIREVFLVWYIQCFVYLPICFLWNLVGLIYFLIGIRSFWCRAINRSIDLPLFDLVLFYWKRTFIKIRFVELKIIRAFQNYSEFENDCCHLENAPDSSFEERSWNETLEPG